MPDLPIDHPQFLAAYAAAAGVTPRAPVRDGSLAAGFQAYKADRAFLDLAAGTKRARRPMIDDSADRYGSARLADLQDRHIQKDLERFEGHARNNRLKMWRAFCSWAVEKYRLSRNAAETVRRAKTKASDGHVPWSAGEIDKFRAYWPLGTAERLAFELIYWTGARVSDAIRLGEGNVDGEGWLTFTQAKTGGEVSLPFNRDLPAFAEGMAGDLALLHQAIASRNVRHITFMTTRHGASRSPKAVSQWFAAKVRAAGIEGRSAHGLRKSRTMALIEAEATTHQVGAWTGHESLSEIARYGKKFNRRKALSRTKEEQQTSNFSGKLPSGAEK